MKITNEKVYDGFTKVNTQIMNIFQFADRFNVVGGFKNLKDEKRVVFEFITKKFGNELPISKLTLDINEKNKSITTIIDDGYEMWENIIENNLSNMFIEELCKFKEYKYEDSILTKIQSDLMGEYGDVPSNMEALYNTKMVVNQTILAHNCKDLNRMLDFSQTFLLLFNPLAIKQLVIDISLTKGIAEFTIYSCKNIPYIVSIDLM